MRTPEAGSRINLRNGAGMRSMPVIGASAEEVANAKVTEGLNPNMAPAKILEAFLGSVSLSDLHGKPKKPGHRH